jgi:two-component system, sensor histidine kinase and response regulator
MIESRKTILIVDDDPENILFTKEMLSKTGYNTISARNSKDALDLIAQNLPTLILLDLMMQDKKGIEVCKLIKDNSNWKDIPVIFLTSRDYKEHLVEGFNAGGDDYITTPYLQEELLVRVKKHEEMATYPRKISEMNKTRDRLFSIIAHDIKSPLSGIQQAIDAIDMGYIDPGSEDFRDIMQHLGKRTRQTSHLLSNLLTWTRVQGESISFEPKNHNIVSLISNSTQFHQVTAEQKNIELITNIDVDAMVYCDENSMNTVFRNLLSNALKFTHCGGKICICSKTSDTGVEISVTDNGVGMCQETVEKLFVKEEFYTSYGTNNEQGTGLGLFVIKDFIRKNKGSLSVQSEPDKGTTIKVTLPKAIAENI